MTKGYDKEIDLYSRDITSHYHCKVSLCIFPLDHDNLQNFMLCTCHDKASPIANPLAPYQVDLQKSLEKCVYDNLQMRHQLLHQKSQKLKHGSLQVFQRKYHCVFP